MNVFFYNGKDIVDVFKNIFVGKSYDFESHCFKPICPEGISLYLLLFQMIAAINLNNEPFGKACKVCNIFAYNILSPEANSLLFLAKMCPQCLFCLCLGKF